MAIADVAQDTTARHPAPARHVGVCTPHRVNTPSLRWLCHCTSSFRPRRTCGRRRQRLWTTHGQRRWTPRQRMPRCGRWQKTWCNGWCEDAEGRARSQRVACGLWCVEHGVGLLLRSCKMCVRGAGFARFDDRLTSVTSADCAHSFRPELATQWHSEHHHRPWCPSITQGTHPSTTVNTFQRNTATAIDSTAGASLRKVVAMIEKIEDTGRTRSRGNRVKPSSGLVSAAVQGTVVWC